MRSLWISSLWACSLALGACSSSESLVADAAIDASSLDVENRPTDTGIRDDVSRPEASADVGRDDVATDVAADTATDAATDATSDAATDATSDAATDATSDAATDATSDAVADASAGDVMAVDGGVRSTLVGDWIESREAMLLSGLHLGAGGDAAYSYVGVMPCTGALTWTGLTWSATDSDVVLSGVGVCRGFIACTVGSMTLTYDCGPFAGGALFSGCGARPYTLSSDGRTLTLGRTCAPGSEVTLTRR